MSVWSGGEASGIRGGCYKRAFTSYPISAPCTLKYRSSHESFTLEHRCARKTRTLNKPAGRPAGPTGRRQGGGRANVEGRLARCDQNSRHHNDPGHYMFCTSSGPYFTETSIYIQWLKHALFLLPQLSVVMLHSTRTPFFSPGRTALHATQGLLTAAINNFDSFVSHSLYSESFCGCCRSDCCW